MKGGLFCIRGRGTHTIFRSTGPRRAHERHCRLRHLALHGNGDHQFDSFRLFAVPLAAVIGPSALDFTIGLDTKPFPIVFRSNHRFVRVII